MNFFLVLKVLKIIEFKLVMKVVLKRKTNKDTSTEKVPPLLLKPPYTSIYACTLLKPKQGSKRFQFLRRRQCFAPLGYITLGCRCYLFDLHFSKTVYIMLFIIKIYQSTADCFSFTKGHSCFYYLMTNSLIEWEGALLILWRHFLSLTKLTFSLLSFFLSSLQNVFLSFYRFFLRLSFFLSIYLSTVYIPSLSVY